MTQILEAWGKTSPDGAHHLAHHCGDVAATLAAILSVRTWSEAASHALGRPITKPETDALTAIAYLHDIGKLAPAFQQVGWMSRTTSIRKTGHLECGWAWWQSVTPKSLDGLISTLGTWPDIRPWVDVSLAHHGRPVTEPHGSNSQALFTSLPWYDWRTEEQKVGQLLRRAVPDLSAAAPPPATPGFLNFFAGLLALADWVGSDTRAFPYVAEFDPEYWSLAQERAAERVAEIGLGPTKLTGPAEWALVSDKPSPRAAQKTIGDLPLDAPLVLIEAETGSGKTEAALWHFARLLAAEKTDGLYFAVPTRAAARQLQGRIHRAVSAMLTDNPEAVLAIPGLAKSGEAEGKRLPGFQVLWDDEANQPTRWAAEHATRFLAARIAVGTIDQVLLSALQVKHAHLRGTALARSLLVIDEVHASDTYMAEILDRVLQDHLVLGGQALLMSATLGAVAASRWMGQPCPPLAEAKTVPYPAISRLGAPVIAVTKDHQPSKSVAMQTHAPWMPEEAAKLAMDAAEQGARVLVIRNTVDMARITWEACGQAAPGLLLSVAEGPALHHSRFAAEDRALLDRAVEGALGHRQTCEGRIVIGTQTLEQSLDICADLLITDLCPMDVLLQRIGRLHRHQNPRPDAFATPKAIVLMPPNGLDPLAERAENGLGAWEKDGQLVGVYLDLPGLAATSAQIDAHPVWEIPSMNRHLVEAATHPDALERMAAERGWTAYRDRMVGKHRAEIFEARHVILDRTVWPPGRYPSDEAIKTRLGAEGALFSLDAPVPGPFGSNIQSFSLPAQWSRGLTGEEEVQFGADGSVDIMREGASLKLTYTRGGFARAS